MIVLERRSATQEEKACGTCGRTIYVTPSDVRAVNFCSQACCTEWRKTLRGERAGGWQGGRAIQKTGEAGRVKVKVHGHPRADREGYVFRYWLVAEETLGRHLLPDEVVHHENCDPTDDRPENLRVFASEAEHRRFHMRLQREARNRGEAAGTAKLNDAAAAQIRALYAAGGVSTYGLARHFRVSQTSIRRVLKKETWRPMGQDIAARGEAAIEEPIGDSPMAERPADAEPVTTPTRRRR